MLIVRDLLPNRVEYHILDDMKKDIHPTYFPHAQIVCSCGNVINTGSTKERIEVEICANCHPFYSGKDKIVDAAGRVEKFKQRSAKKKGVVQSRREKKKEKREKRKQK